MFKWWSKLKMWLLSENNNQSIKSTKRVWYNGNRINQVWERKNRKWILIKEFNDG